MRKYGVIFHYNRSMCIYVFRCEIEVSCTRLTTRSHSLLRIFNIHSNIFPLNLYRMSFLLSKNYHLNKNTNRKTIAVNSQKSGENLFTRELIVILLSRISRNFTNSILRFFDSSKSLYTVSWRTETSSTKKYRWIVPRMNQLDRDLCDPGSKHIGHRREKLEKYFTPWKPYTAVKSGKWSTQPNPGGVNKVSLKRK